MPTMPRSLAGAANMGFDALVGLGKPLMVTLLSKMSFHKRTSENVIQHGIHTAEYHKASKGINIF